MEFNTQYQVKDYFHRLLDRIGVEHEEDDLRDYMALVNYSVGFNPRSMKRLFNSLLLLGLVAEQRQVLEEVEEQAEQREVSKILFAILCLQNAYEPVYRFLARKSELDDELFEQLRDEERLTGDDELATLRGELGHEGDALYYKKVARFMEAFFSAIQLDSDEEDGEEKKADQTLSRDEARTFRRIMSFSAVVSTSAGEEEIDASERQWNRQLAKGLAAELNEKYKEVLDSVRSDLSRHGFSTYQARSTDEYYAEMYIASRSQECSLVFTFDTDVFSGYVCARKKRSIPQTQAWAEGPLKDIYPALEEWEDDEWGAPLFYVEMSGDWDTRAEAFKIRVHETVEQLLPAFIARCQGS